MNNPRRIDHRCLDLGLRFGCWAPGDGVRRYRFFRGDDSGSPHADYDHADGLATCLGMKEAHTWLDGFAFGLRAGRDESRTVHESNRALRYGLTRQVPGFVATVHSEDEDTEGAA